MADGARVDEDLVVAAAGLGLVAEEVDGRELALGDEAEAEGLVPADGTAVDADLAADAERERKLGRRPELVVQRGDESDRVSTCM